MTRLTHGTHRGAAVLRRSSAVGLALAAAAAVLLGLALRGSAPEEQAVPGQADRPVPVADVRPVGGWMPRPAGTAPAPEAARPRPVHLTIASISVSTDLVRLGLRPDRTVEVPQDAALAGWFEEGPVPGEQGASVVLGHVDSAAGPAVFHRLAELAPGDRLRVRLTDGATARFEVRRVATYANDAFPAREVYAGDPDGRALNLVTCGGWYDADRGGWQANVVVFTELLPAA